MNYEREIARKFCASYNEKQGREVYSISTKTIYPEYYSGEKNGTVCIDLEAFMEFSRVVETGIASGAFSSNQDKKTSVYKTIKATSGQIETLAALHGLTLQREYMEAMHEVLIYYQRSKYPAISAWVSVQRSDDKFEVIKRWFKYNMEVSPAESAKELRRLLELCEAVLALKSDVLTRNFSTVNAIGSKDFEQNFKHRVCAILAPDDFADEVDANEILKSLHLLQNPASVWLKGDAQIEFINGDVLTCERYATPLAFTRDWVMQIKDIKINSLLTIENLTTFNDYPCVPGELVIFTSGYANSLVVDLICKCAERNTLVDPRHFGDIDAFGFKILRNLISRTAVSFRPHLMDIATYETYKRYAIPITDCNRDSFYKMMENPSYSLEHKALFSHLIEEGNTLEQEAIGRIVAVRTATTS